MGGGGWGKGVGDLVRDIGVIIFYNFTGGWLVLIEIGTSGV